jgi:hypothetical protein
MNRSDKFIAMTHYDCKYYLNTDVFKGLCKRDKTIINADDAACDHFEKAQKCKDCEGFTSTGSEMGTCRGKFDAYPEMNAVTCHDFNWN